MKQQSPELIVVGALLGAHGVRGDVRVKSFTAQPEALFDYAPFLNEQGEDLLQPTGFRAAKDHFIVTPKTPRQKEDWDRLKGTRLYVSRDMLPAPDEDEFYIQDLVGLDVYGGGEARIGRVKAVLNHGAGDLLEILAIDRRKPVLVPFTLEDVPSIDLAARRLIVADFEVWADESRPDPEA